MSARPDWTPAEGHLGRVARDAFFTAVGGVGPPWPGLTVEAQRPWVATARAVRDQTMTPRRRGRPARVVGVALADIAAGGTGEVRFS